MAPGSLTDMEVAFETAMISRNDLDIEAKLATARDRIRWLSVCLAAAEAASSRRSIYEVAPEEGQLVILTGIERLVNKGVEELTPMALLARYTQGQFIGIQTGHRLCHRIDRSGKPILVNYHWAPAPPELEGT
jgi:hypothetical protein